MPFLLTIDNRMRKAESTKLATDTLTKITEATNAKPKTTKNSSPTKTTATKKTSTKKTTTKSTTTKSKSTKSSTKKK